MVDWRARLLAALRGSLPAPATAALASVAAAVLVPIIERGAEPTVLLTVRAAHLKHHAGQVSFPGGRIEPADSGPSAAALREAWEEIGLPPQNVQVVGYLPDRVLASGYHVTPVVALVQPGFTLRFDDGEVQEAFEVPLAHVLEPCNHLSRRLRIQEREVETRVIAFGGRDIWGATAGILMSLCETVNA